MIRKLQVGIIDLVSKKPNKKLFARIMNANFASIMPQVVGVWCEEEGHDVTYICYTGKEDLIRELPQNADIIFIGSFTEAAQTAYALSNLLRSRGAVTVLGGPHARCYPEDALKYFDYVTGFTDKNIIREILYDCSPHRPTGLHLTAQKQPLSLPGVKERWKFIEPTLMKAPLIKMVPMLGSL
ncbi:MAG: cobalamin-dependent protein, partial [Ignavibacteriaceae bacterium]